MSDLGWIFDIVQAADVERTIDTLERRMLKLNEEQGELGEAYLSVTSLQNAKNKTWDDVREEAVDVAIMALDILATPFPKKDWEQEGYLTSDEYYGELVLLFKSKIKKWEEAKQNQSDLITCYKDL